MRKNLVYIQCIFLLLLSSCTMQTFTVEKELLENNDKKAEQEEENKFPPQSSEIIPVLTLSRTSGVAPLAVQFNAAKTTGPTSIPFHDLHYSWNFGDQNSGTWAHFNKSKNSAEGPITAHVYETPGAYKVTLTIRGKNGHVKTVEKNIVVNDPDVAFAPPYGETYYFSTDGDFSTLPASVPGNRKITTSSFKEIITYAETNHRLLLKRGNQWLITEAESLTNPGPGHIGAFGPCQNEDERGICSNAPKLVATDAGVKTSGLLIEKAASDWRVADIELIGRGDKYSRGMYLSTDNANTLISRVNMHKFDGIFYTRSIKYATVYNCYFHDIYDLTLTSSAGNVIFMGGKGSAILGGRFENSSHGEHVVRITTPDELVISYNLISYPDQNKHALKIHTFSDPSNWSEYGVISHNEFRSDVDTSLSIGPAGPEAGNADQNIRHYIIEKNLFVETGAGHLQVASHFTTVRNNLFLGLNNSAISLGKRGYNLVPEGNQIYNNTAHTGSFLGLGEYINVVINNNIWYAPHVTSKLNKFISSGSATISGISSDNNLFFKGNSPESIFLQAGSGNYYTLTQWESISGQDKNSIEANPAFISPATSDYHLLDTSPAINNGKDIPAFITDYDLELYNSTMDIGAYKY